MTESVDPRDTEAEEVVGAAEAAQPTTAPAATARPTPSSRSCRRSRRPWPTGHRTPCRARGSTRTPLAAERLLDLQRLQAEYVNYKRRVDRDRAMVQERAVQDVLETLLPVLDDIHAAREHGDLQTGPFARSPTSSSRR